MAQARHASDLRERLLALAGKVHTLPPSDMAAQLTSIANSCLDGSAREQGPQMPETEGDAATAAPGSALASTAQEDTTDGAPPASKKAGKVEWM